MSPGAAKVDREVTLVHLLEVVKGHWKAIVAVGVLTLLLNVGVFLALPVAYQAESSILLSRSRSKAEPTGIDTTSVGSDAFALALQSGEVMEKALKKFNLDQPPYEYDVQELQQTISIWALRRENTLQVRVKLRNLQEGTQKLVADIANFFLEEADKLAKELLKQDIERSVALLEEEYRRSEQRLEEYRKHYQAVKLGAKIESQRKVLDSLGFGLSKLMEQFSIAQYDYANNSALVEALDRLLADEKELLSVRRALEEEPALMAAYAEKAGVGASSLYSATSTVQEPNEVYIALRALRDEAQGKMAGAKNALETLPDKIQGYKDDLEATERILNASEEAELFWKGNLTAAQLAFQEVYERREVAAMAIVADRQDLLTWVRAYPPLRPTGLPRPVLATASAVLAMAVLAVLILLLEVFRAIGSSVTGAGKESARA
ncbi:MAG: hypothetical protein HUU16_21140 [Candidatus Omnitrophica bacterium]|nr:hypothetical protein [bacterium]NUN98669.1 hypothetical protein [Candidatus Omnitrophota bacterium]